MTRFLFPVLLAAAAGIIAGGCASVSTLPGEGVSDATRLRRPAEIWVGPFATDGGMWLKESAQPEKRAEIRDWLSGSLLKHLAPIAPTFLVEEEPPASGWLISGRFLRVNPGSRMGRMFFGGIGGGASRLETRVNVYDLAVSTAQPVLTFTTSGGSNLAHGLHGVATAIDNDVDRTAREIRAFLEERLWPGDEDVRALRAPEAIDEIEIAPAPR